MEFSYLAAFMIGLLGSTHCLGMCGGIVSALNLEDRQKPRSATSILQSNLSYNAGRITSYAIAGAIAGLLGALVSQSALGVIAPIGRLLAGIIMILLGLYLSGWTRLLAPLEKAGYHLWKRIEPHGRRFIPARTAPQAFGLGLVWGWLPCGLVYSALAMAAVSASPAGGALTMLAFGAGTLPMLMAMGGAAKLLYRLARNPIARRATGAAMMLFGAYICFVALTSGSHHEHMNSNHTAISPAIQLDTSKMDLSRFRAFFAQTELYV